MIQTLLKDLGLTEKEILVYMTVLQQGKVSPADVAKLTGINRTTVYSISQELQKKGMIREDAGKTKYLLARPPHDLSDILEREQEQLKRKEHVMNRLIGELEPLTKNMRYSVPHMTFTDEEQLRRTLYKEAEKWTKSILQYDGVWHGFQDHTFVEHYEDWVDWYWTQAVFKDASLQLLTNESGIEGKMKGKKYNRRKMKFWEQSDFTATVWINGDYLVMIMTQTRPHYMFEIYDKTLAHNMREVFKEVWGKL